MADQFTIDLSKIRIDGGTQNRVQIDQDTVQEYSNSITEGATFPPVTVFFDGASYWLADGFHRYHAHQSIGALNISAHVINGTQRDAVLHSVGVNATHGLKRTNADKRKSVDTLLNDPEWSKWSDREIARQCYVSNHLVADIRKSHLGEFPDSDNSPSCDRSQDAKRIVERNGKTYEQDTSNIGKAQQKKESDVKPKALKKISPEKQELKVVESDFQEESDYDPEQDQINELSHTINDLQEENEKLRSALAINQIPEGLEIEDADTIIDTLRARVKQLEIEVKAITQSRDTYLRENSQLKEQIRRQAAQLKKLGGKASA